MNSLKKQSAKCSLRQKFTSALEVNFCPIYPSAETEESLEVMQRALLLDVKKNNRVAVKLKMENTVAHRRHEVVRDAPMVASFMARWPALLEVSEVRHMLGFF